VGIIEKAEPVKLFCGILHAPDISTEEILSSLTEIFGAIDLQSSSIPFTFTSYYAKEMGEELIRFFSSFSLLQDPANAADWKISSTKLEERFLKKASSSRLVNIDPGYLVSSRLLLLTTKDFSHRVYLRDGIYAEVTLSWRRGSFQRMPWTYPDYNSSFARDFFTKVRNKYILQRKSDDSDRG